MFVIARWILDSCKRVLKTNCKGAAMLNIHREGNKRHRLIPTLGSVINGLLPLAFNQTGLNWASIIHKVVTKRIVSRERPPLVKLILQGLIFLKRRPSGLTFLGKLSEDGLESWRPGGLETALLLGALCLPSSYNCFFSHLTTPNY